MLGRLLLKAICFDLKKHLEAACDNVDGKDISDLVSTTAKHYAASYDGITYHLADEDTTELQEFLAARIGQDTKESIDNAFVKISEEEKYNGISDVGLTRITKLLETCRDIFRIKLGEDPTAKVQPLVITRAVNARPFCSLQLRYALRQRDLIIKGAAGCWCYLQK